MAKRPLNVRFRLLTCPTQTDRPSRKQKSRYQFFFDKDQTWARPRVDPEFWDETEDLVDGYTGDTELSLQQASPVPLSISRKSGVQSAEPSPIQTSQQPTPQPAQSTPRSESSQAERGWPFHTEEEAFLFRHFQQVPLRAIEVSDRDQHFRNYVNEAIHESSMVLYAICALTSRYLCFTDGWPTLTPLLYQEKCLSLLLPILEKPEVRKDLNVLATTCMLRMFEELDSPSPSEDEQRHLLGTSLLLMGPKIDLSSETSSVIHTIVWCHLRQEIYVSFALQQPLRINLDDLVYDLNAPCTDDITWANRIVWHTAEVMRWAFSDGDKLVSEWNRLWNRLSSWEAQRPRSFLAICRRDADLKDGRLWPEMWFAQGEHANAAMMIRFAKIVLFIHDPTFPRMGSRAARAAAKVKHEVQSLTRELCAIALSSNFEPNYNGACTAINVLGGEFITDREEQLACIRFLEAAEPKSGWPTKSTVARLRREWDI